MLAKGPGESVDVGALNQKLVGANSPTPYRIARAKHDPSRHAGGLRRAASS